MPLFSSDINSDSDSDSSDLEFASIDDWETQVDLADDSEDENQDTDQETESSEIESTQSRSVDQPDVERHFLARSTQSFGDRLHTELQSGGLSDSSPARILIDQQLDTLALFTRYILYRRGVGSKSDEVDETFDGRRGEFDQFWLIAEEAYSIMVNKFAQQLAELEREGDHRPVLTRPGAWGENPLIVVVMLYLLYPPSATEVKLGFRDQSIFTLDFLAANGWPELAQQGLASIVDLHPDGHSTWKRDPSHPDLSNGRLHFPGCSSKRCSVYQEFFLSILHWREDHHPCSINIKCGTPVRLFCQQHPNPSASALRPDFSLTRRVATSAFARSRGLPKFVRQDFSLQQGGGLDFAIYHPSSCCYVPKQPSLAYFIGVCLLDETLRFAVEVLGSSVPLRGRNRGVAIFHLDSIQSLTPPFIILNDLIKREQSLGRFFTLNELEEEGGVHFVSALLKARLYYTSFLSSALGPVTNLSHLVVARVVWSYRGKQTLATTAAPLFHESSPNLLPLTPTAAFSIESASSSLGRQFQRFRNTTAAPVVHSTSNDLLLLQPNSVFAIETVESVAQFLTALSHHSNAAPTFPDHHLDQSLLLLTSNATFSVERQTATVNWLSHHSRLRTMVPLLHRYSSDLFLLHPNAIFCSLSLIHAQTLTLSPTLRLADQRPIRGDRIQPLFIQPSPPADALFLLQSDATFAITCHKRSRLTTTNPHSTWISDATSPAGRLYRLRSAGPTTGLKMFSLPSFFGAPDIRLPTSICTSDQVAIHLNSSTLEFTLVDPADATTIFSRPCTLAGLRQAQRSFVRLCQDAPSVRASLGLSVNELQQIATTLRSLPTSLQAPGIRRESKEFWFNLQDGFIEIFPTYVARSQLLRFALPQCRPLSIYQKQMHIPALPSIPTPGRIFFVKASADEWLIEYDDTLYAMEEMMDASQIDSFYSYMLDWEAL